jgi:hypothetical protein
MKKLLVFSTLAELRGSLSCTKSVPDFPLILAAGRDEQAGSRSLMKRRWRRLGGGGRSWKR